MATAEKSHAVEFRLLHTKGDLERIRRAVERNPYHRILKNGRIYYKEGEDIMARRLDPPDSPPQTCATLAYMLTAAGHGELKALSHHGKIMVDLIRAGVDPELANDAASDISSRCPCASCIDKRKMA